MNLLETHPTLKLKRKLTDSEVKAVCSKFRERITELSSKDPIASIVVPAYNEEMYILLMIRALTHLSTKHPIEFIGVDNNSTDRTGDIFNESGFITINEKRKGTSYARQRGLGAAKGEFIFTTDADTLVPTTWIDSSLKYFLENKNLVCFSGGVNRDTLGTSKIYDILRQYVRKRRKNAGKKKYDFSGANSVFSKEMALKVGGYEPGRDIGEDCLLAKKLSLYGDILTVNDNHDVQVSTSGRRTSNAFLVLRMFRERAKYIFSENDNLRKGKTFSDVR